MSTLLLRLPAHAITETTVGLKSDLLPCAYTLRSRRDVIEREGYATLSELAALISRAKHVVLLLAAADVTLLRMAVPPLSAAKLRTALPNLIEDRLLGDVSECVVVCSAMTGGLRSVAVVRREWLAQLVQTVRGLGAQHISAVPEQLCLALHDDQVSAAISEYENGIALALRLSEHEGLGIVQNTPDEILHALRSLVPSQDISLIVPPAALQRYQAALAQDGRIKVSADNGSHWQLPIPALDLAAGSGAQPHQQLDWQPWRWPLALAALLLLVHTSALNFDWLRMNREAADLRANMKHIYLAAYPKETVILDPLLQMRQKIAANRHDAGLASADDFTTLAAEFGQAWTSVMASSNVNPGANAAIASIGYREHSLLIQLKSAVPTAAMKSALAERKLSLEPVPESELTWQIRSTR